MTDARFGELMYAAGLTASGCFENMDDYDQQAIQKFAELIVEQCAIIVLTANLEGVEGGDSAVLCAASEQIKEHFGVQ
jgi:hypothetical protein